MDRKAAFAEAVHWAECLADRLHRRLPPHVRARVAVDDLLQEARLALWVSSERWDATLCPLWPYAYARTQGAILDYIAESCRVQHLPLEQSPELAAEERDPGLAIDTRRALEQPQPLPRIAEAQGHGAAGKSLSVREVAKIRGLSEAAIRQRLEKGAIRGVKRGRVWRVPSWAAAG